MKNSSKSIETLINQLHLLPGIGIKTAQRLAYYILDMDEDKVNILANSIISAKKEVQQCSICCNFSDNNPCEICSDNKKDKSIICILEHPRDVEAMERANCYNGLYHVLHGVIAPMKNVGPKDLKIRELINRLKEDSVKEIIIATNPTVEGDTTALYISKLLKPIGIKVSRIGYGLPVGGNLEYYDEVTISTAIENRKEI